MRLILPIGLALLATIAAGCQAQSAAAPHVLVAQKGVGAPFGAPDPYACTSTTYPKHGGISVAMARQYFICGLENVDGNGNLELAENVKLQVGKGVIPRGTFYVPRADQDPKAKTYALRGTYDWYTCQKQAKGFVIDPSIPAHSNNGQNCTLVHVTKAHGDCYRTTFGDWKCGMTPMEGPTLQKQPPPKA